MAVDEDIRVEFENIQSSINKHEYDNVLLSAQKVLDMNADDSEAFLCKVTSLIHLQRFEEALDNLSSSSLKNDETIGLKAYALYRLKRNEEAHKAVQEISKKNTFFYHLSAQINCRLGEFSRAASDLSQILELNGDDNDVLSNLVSCLVEAGDFNRAIDVSSASLENPSHDLFYNVACAHIGLGDYSSALKLLDSSYATEYASLKKEGLLEDQIQIELSDILCQKAFVLQVLGRKEEAFAIYNSILHFTEGVTDSTIATAASNSIACKKVDEKLFDSMKRIARAVRVPDDKLSESQRFAIRFNNCLLALFEKHNQKCRDLIRELQESGNDSFNLHLIIASLFFREKKFTKCDEELVKCLEKFPANSGEICFFRAQIKLLQGDTKSALESLTQSESTRYMPGSVATTVSLYESLGDSENALKTLKDSVNHWSNSADSQRKQYLTSLRTALAQFMFEKGMFEEALSEFEISLKDSNDNSSLTVARLVKASAMCGNLSSARYSSQLPALEGIEELNVESLEENILVPLNIVRRRALKEEEPVSNSESAPVQKPQTKRRKKRIRYPKNFDPENPGSVPDPERWLPKWQRTSRRRRKSNAVMKGPQGSSAPSAQQSKLDHSDPQNSVKPESASKPVKNSNGKNKKKKRR